MSTPGEHTEEQIVGYDAREHWLTTENWTEERKQSFLYRLNVLKPLSIDRRVWPTIFEAEQRPIPTQRSGFQDCWSDFSSLQSAVTQAFQEEPMRAWRMIAITLILGNYCQGDDVPWSSRLPPTYPNQRSASWVFLGYDVGDQWMLSVLSNCGFLPGLDDVPKLRNEWGGRLNQFHLFQHLDDAIAFKGFSDDRLRADQAPCFVFGLWIVK